MDNIIELNKQKRTEEVKENIFAALRGEAIGDMEVLSPKAWVDLIKLVLSEQIISFDKEDNNENNIKFKKFMGMK